MNNTRKFRFALSTLLRASDTFRSALSDDKFATAMAARLDAPDAAPPLVFLADFDAKLAAVRAEVANQTSKTGDAGALTSEQRAAFDEVERLTAGARRSARLAFPGDEKLRSEFQVGVDEPKDLASELARANKTLTAAKKYAAALKQKGWIAADATALEAALGQLSGVALDQDEALADRAQFTASLARKANDLYDGCLTIQNAARLQYPSTLAGTEAARVRFQLETFPPRDRSQPDGGTQPQQTPPPTPPTV